MKTKTGKDETLVIFRKYKDNGEILALFPEIKDSFTYGGITCYERIGQHGAADYNYCIDITTPASEIEYAPLRAELESIGYNLIVRKKWIR